MRRADRLLALLVALAPATAAAFPGGKSFDLDPISVAGGGGVNYTGAPDFPGATCATCHVDPPGLVGVRLDARDPSLFSIGYRPGDVYELEVQLVGETLGLEHDGPALCGSVPGKGFVPCNTNGFGIQASDVTGAAAGTFCPVALQNGGACNPPKNAPTVLSADGTALHQTGTQSPPAFENGVTAWRFYWLAPAAGTGPVTFHIGAVDGNGGAGTADVPQDVFGDDTVQAHIPVAEIGGGSEVQSSGCGVARAGGRALALPALAVFAIALSRRRRRPR